MEYIRAGIFKQSLGARNRVGIGLSYRPARLHIGWRNSFLGSIPGLQTFKNTGSGRGCSQTMKGENKSVGILTGFGRKKDPQIGHKIGEGCGQQAVPDILL